MKLLHIDSSILDDASISRQLSADIIDRLRDILPIDEVIGVDLVTADIGHLTGAEFMALQGVEPESDATREAVTRNERVLEDFISADVVVIGAPMYNLSLPSQLKAWLDRIAVAGRTFKYTSEGPVGLAGGKRVIIASSRGGLYGEGSPTAFLDHQETYLRGFFAFLGIDDVSVVRAEGLAYGEEARTAALAQASADIAALQA